MDEWLPSTWFGVFLRAILVFENRKQTTDSYIF